MPLRKIHKNIHLPGVSPLNMKQFNTSPVKEEETDPECDNSSDIIGVVKCADLLEQELNDLDSNQSSPSRFVNLNCAGELFDPIDVSLVFLLPHVLTNASHWLKTFLVFRDVPAAVFR